MGHVNEKKTRHYMCHENTHFGHRVLTPRLMNLFLSKLEHGEEIWLEILERAGVKHTIFNTRQIYPDALMTDLAAAVAEYRGDTMDNTMQFFGKCFVKFFSNLGQVSKIC